MFFLSNKETKLFAELSDKQQELVSGGGIKGYTDGYDSNEFGLSKTTFAEKHSNLNTFSASGDYGSIAGGNSSKELTKTSGLNIIFS